jgi:hypothetical protein
MNNSTSFNIYDSKSDFYSTRCKPLGNDTSEGDITINQRRKEIYKNLSLSCGKCSLIEIDDFDNTVCHCKNTTGGIGFIENMIFEKASLYNLDIVLCVDSFISVNIYIIFINFFNCMYKFIILIFSQI